MEFDLGHMIEMLHRGTGRSKPSKMAWSSSPRRHLEGTARSSRLQPPTPTPWPPQEGELAEPSASRWERTAREPVVSRPDPRPPAAAKRTSCGQDDRHHFANMGLRADRLGSHGPNGGVRKTACYNDSETGPQLGPAQGRLPHPVQQQNRLRPDYQAKKGTAIFLTRV